MHRDGGTCPRPHGQASSTPHRSLITSSPSLPVSAEGAGGQGSVEGFAISLKNKVKGFNTLQPPTVLGCPRQRPSPFPEGTGRKKSTTQHMAGPRAWPGSAHNTLGLSQEAGRVWGGRQAERPGHCNSERPREPLAISARRKERPRHRALEKRTSSPGLPSQSPDP